MRKGGATNGASCDFKGRKLYLDRPFSRLPISIEVDVLNSAKIVERTANSVSSTCYSRTPHHISPG